MDNGKKKVAEVHAEIVVDLKQEDVDDIMVIVLEGGVTAYWCRRCEVIGGEYLGEYASEQISRGGALRFYDAESDDTWDLDLEKFAQGFRRWLENGGDVYGAVSKLGVDTGEIDAEAADCIIQYALFGEVVFG